MIRLKRAYEKPARQDGLRVLVERLWPRGVTRQQAAVDLWLRDVAPSTELRKWFAHDPLKWPAFRKRYRAELRQKSDLLAELKGRCREGPVTFVYAARDQEHNGAVVLKELLQGK
ncbi:MAG: DUF488 domain-containing protein [Thermoguttaceae bacterium]|jgi:uncharacterized protein YeaO (DUF488 family)